MKKIFFIYISLLIAGSVFAQKKSFAKTDFKFGSGVETQFNDGDYLLNVGGFIQTDGKYTKTEGSKAENRFDIKSAYLTIAGNAVNEKVGFVLRLDFAESSPLMDAIITYQPISFLNLSVGQKQTFTNNREMMFMENTLSMVNRSMLSEKLSGKGRELGIFAESEFLLGNIGIMPQIAVTTGDGRNSFGTSSTDVDRGGLKYGARLDICPLGLFTKGNDLIEADLAREQTPKVKVGVAGSYNSGASNSMGEGHGDFTLYNEEGKDKLPDYRKVYLDILFKYQGFSVLGEYGNFSATRLKGIYKNSNGTGLLEPGQISEYLNLGDSYNIQAGYVLRNGLAFDLRYSKTKPEFENNSNSVLKNINAYDVAVTKYFVDNRLKIQGGFSYLDYKSEAIRNEIKAEVLLQVTF